MATVQLRLHPGVAPSQSAGYRQRGRSAHLTQGALTGCCGGLAVLMSLVVLGVATRAHIRSLRLMAEGDRLEPTWQKVQELFFTGADEEEMLDLLSTLDRHLRYRLASGSMRKVLAFVLDRLAQGDVVITGLGDLRTYGHWVLAIGVEQLVVGSARTTTGVLCLDPAEAAPQVAPFNTKLDLESPSRGARKLYYHRPGGMHLVTCSSAIALSRRR